MTDGPRNWGKAWKRGLPLMWNAKKRMKAKPKPAVRGLSHPDFGALNELFGIPRT